MKSFSHLLFFVFLSLGPLALAMDDAWEEPAHGLAALTLAPAGALQGPQPPWPAFLQLDPSLPGLGPDLQRHIASFLGAKDRAHFGAVSRGLHGAIEHLEEELVQRFLQARAPVLGYDILDFSKVVALENWEGQRHWPKRCASLDLPLHLLLQRAFTNGKYQGCYMLERHSLLFADFNNAARLAKAQGAPFSKVVGDILTEGMPPAQALTLRGGLEDLYGNYQLFTLAHTLKAFTNSVHTSKEKWQDYLLERYVGPASLNLGAGRDVVITLGDLNDELTCDRLHTYFITHTEAKLILDADVEILQIRYIPQTLRNLELVNINKRLREIGYYSQGSFRLASFETRGLTSLTTIGDRFLELSTNLVSFDARGLTSLTAIGNSFLSKCFSLGRFDAQGLHALRTIGYRFLGNCPCLVNFDIQHLTSINTIGAGFLRGCSSLGPVDTRGLRSLTTIGNGFLQDCPCLLHGPIDPALRAFMERFPNKIWPALCRKYDMPV